MEAGLSTLCYIEKEGKYLMLHRVVKKNDVNKDKWIGVGGHFEQDESPEECILREVKEETGYTLTSWKYRGLVTFVSGGGVTEYMHLFTADGFTGEPTECDEGVLEWIDIEKVWKINIWAGDKIFFRLLDEKEPFFSLKLVYNGGDKLVSAALNGHPMELFDLVDEEGKPTGVVQERGVVHREGSRHATAHMWIIRRKAGLSEPSGTLSDYEVLLQKRSACKDAYPGCYDISSAGHIAAGDTPIETAVREMKEELGLSVQPEDLTEIGIHRGQFEHVFHGKLFRDREYSHVYVCEKPFSDADLKLQESEVESVLWMDVPACRKKIDAEPGWSCIYKDEFDMLISYISERLG